jgi:hypothetical protein
MFHNKSTECDWRQFENVLKSDFLFRIHCSELYKKVKAIKE